LRVAQTGVQILFAFLLGIAFQQRFAEVGTLGRAVFVNRGEGLLAPSARIPLGVNVVYFPQNHQTGSSVKVLDAEKLERLRLA
jgi:hypothetical protein